MTKEVNKTELSEIVGVKNLRKLSSEKIREKLLNECWELINIEKRGREVIYTLKYKEQNFNINNYMQNEFKVKDGGKLMNHTKIRVKSIKEDKPTTRKEISEKTGTSERTALSYDKKLEEKDVIKKDGFYYICKNTTTQEVCLTDKKAYDNFWWINKTIDKDIQRIFNQYQKNKISRKECEFLVDEKKNEIKSDFYYYKVSRYLINYSSELYQLIKNYI